MLQKMTKTLLISLVLSLCIGCLFACAKSDGKDLSRDEAEITAQDVPLAGGSGESGKTDEELIEGATSGNGNDGSEDGSCKEDNEVPMSDSEITGFDSEHVTDTTSQSIEEEEITAETTESETSEDLCNRESSESPEVLEEAEDKNGDSAESITEESSDLSVEGDGYYCNHTETYVVNKVKASCNEMGYSGDVYCVKCNAFVSCGWDTRATGHVNTVIRDQIEATTEDDGHTGITYCVDCGTVVSFGDVIPKIGVHDNKIKLIMSDGTHVLVDSSIDDITAYYMSQCTQYLTHVSPEFENEFLILCNEERAKVGLEPLWWFEDAYYFTQMRAEELSVSWSHTRPNGKKWYSVYYDEGVVISGKFGENLGRSRGCVLNADFAQVMVDSWMASAGHRANILNPDFSRIAISIVQDGTDLYVVQHFFS